MHRIEAVLGDHLENVLGRWLAVDGRLVRCFGRNADSVKGRPGRAEQLFQPGVHPVRVFQGVITAADTRLVGEEEEFVTQRPRLTQRAGGAGNELHPAGSAR